MLLRMMKRGRHRWEDTGGMTRCLGCFSSQKRCVTCVEVFATGVEPPCCDGVPVCAATHETCAPPECPSIDRSNGSSSSSSRTPRYAPTPRLHRTQPPRSRPESRRNDNRETAWEANARPRVMTGRETMAVLLFSGQVSELFRNSTSSTSKLQLRTGKGAKCWLAWANSQAKIARKVGTTRKRNANLVVEHHLSRVQHQPPSFNGRTCREYDSVLL